MSVSSEAITRDTLRNSTGIDLAGSAGMDTMDVAITGGASSNGPPADFNQDGIPDIVLAVSGGHNMIYYGPGASKHTW